MLEGQEAKVREYFLKMSEGWAHMAYLITCSQVQEHGAVEQALEYAIFYLWASEEAV